MDQLAHAWAWISAHPAETAVAVYAALSGLVAVYRSHEDAIKARVKKTETGADDWIVSTLDKVVAVFEVLRLFVPHAIAKPREDVAIKGGGSTALVITLIGALAAPGMIGCGSTAQQQHETLNTITDIADPSYGIAINACDNLRNLILERTGSTWERDHDDMVRVNGVCDRIVAGFELLRDAQLTARHAIDEGAEGAIDEALQHVLDVWHELQALVPEIRGLGLAGGA